MRRFRMLEGFVASMLVSMSVGAQQDRGIGYPSVSAALDALRSRSDVNVSVQGGWTIIDDRSARAQWSFAPPDHPAHPAAIRRTVVERNGQLYLDMQALCQASKSACDRLVADFKVLNEKIAQTVRSDVQAKQDAQWRPTEEQEKLIEQQTHAYFSAKDGRKYEEAYALLSLSRQKTTSFDQWRGMRAKFSSLAGEVKSRKIKKVTWYKDPPNAPAAGIYAAADFVSEFANVETHCGYIVWHQQEDGVFKIVREEEGYIDSVTQQKMKQSDLEAVRKQFGC